jgi:DNA-binding ferritin-like protein (Dps family)
MTLWIDRVVGDLADKRSYRGYRARVRVLPPAYRDATLALERHLMNMGPSDDGAALVAMLGDLADLVEQSAADGTPVRDLVGEDPAEFAETFLEYYAGGSWIRTERRRLAESIDRAVAEVAD